MSDTGSRVNPVNALAPKGVVTVDLAVPDVALAIGAHPDDIEFGCGATLAKWARAGTRIHHLVLTDGAKGTWDREVDVHELIEQRKVEQRNAAKLLGGGDVEFLGYTDGELHNDAAVRWQVAKSIRTLRPDVVLGHDPWRRYRLHPDHRHAGFITTDAIVAARDPHFFPDQLLTPHRPRALLLWEADEPNHVEDAAGYTDSKIAALMAHVSQHQSTMGIDGSGEQHAVFAGHVRQQLAAHGALAGRSEGESFHCITDT